VTDDQLNETADPMADAPLADEVVIDDVDTARAESDVAPLYGIGPFTVRELSLIGVWLVAFVFSFFPVYQVFSTGPSVWTAGIDWILTIGVPTVAVFLIVLRRFSPDGIRRVGSLGVDQFASVAFSVSTVVWATTIWTVFAGLPSRLWGSAWVAWVEIVLMLAGVVLTVFAPFIPVLEDDFLGRREIVAHRNARPVRALSARPARPQRPEPAAAPFVEEPQPVFEEAAPAAVAEPVVEAEPQPATAHQAFWALAPEERDVVDENGIPLFRIGPTAWALVIEDRGSAYVVRHEDGRVGYLRDVSNITRG
jgi:hypothetical protein